MAAEERLTLRMNAVGTDGVERELGEVEIALRDVDRQTRRVNESATTFRGKMAAAASPTNAVARALRITSTRTVLATSRFAALAVVLVALSPLLFELAAGLTAFGALAGASFLVGLGAAGRFKDTVSLAGSAANHLAEAWEDFTWQFAKVMAPGADIILQALADALVMLMPLLVEIQPGLTTFAIAMAEAIGVLANGLAGMGPEFNDLLVDLAPRLPELAYAALELADALVLLAAVGVPSLIWLIGALEDFGIWLQDAIKWMENFIDESGYLDDVSETFGLLGSILEDLGRIADVVWPVLDLVFQAANEVRLNMLRDAAFATDLLADALEELEVAAANAYAWFEKDGPDAVWDWIKTAMYDLTNFLIEQLNWFIDQINAVSPFGDIERIGKVGPGEAADPRGTNILGAKPPVLGLKPENRLGAKPPGNKRRPLIPGVRRDQELGATHPFAQAGGDVVIPWTWQMDGKTIAKGVHRQVVKKKSTR
jgi:hypothetical protein